MEDKFELLATGQAVQTCALLFSHSFSTHVTPNLPLETGKQAVVVVVCST